MVICSDGDFLILAQQVDGLAQLAHGLWRCVPFSCRHSHRAFLPTTWAAMLSQPPDQISSGQVRRIRKARTT